MATSQNEALLVAVFRQLAVTKLDYGILGKDLGLSREAARNRWVRFQVSIFPLSFLNAMKEQLLGPVSWDQIFMSLPDP